MPDENILKLQYAYVDVVLKTPTETHTNTHTHLYTHTYTHTHKTYDNETVTLMLEGRKSRQVANKVIRTDSLSPPTDR